jgi:outer membrane protein assembly factor BamB
MPANPAMQADGGIAFISGANYPKGTMVAAPLTAVSAVTGKTLWHASVGFLYAMWTAPRQLVFGSQSGTYDVNPATGARRWRVPGEASAPDLPADLLLTATNVLYFPNGGVLTDRRPGDGAVAWRQPRAHGGGSGTFIAGPSGPNALIAVSNNFDNAPETVVYPVNLRTGELAASVKLPSDLPAAPAVTGHDTIYELNPENCIYLGAAGQSPKN